MQQERLTMTVTEAAQVLGVSAKSVRRIASAGQLRTVRVGRKVLVPRDALAEFLSPSQ